MLCSRDCTIAERICAAGALFARAGYEVSRIVFQYLNRLIGAAFFNKKVSAHQAVRASVYCRFRAVDCE